MIDHLLIPRRGDEGRPIAEVADYEPHPPLSERVPLLGGAHQRGHFVAPRQQGIDEMASDETGPPGNQRLHSARSSSR